MKYNITNKNQLADDGIDQSAVEMASWLGMLLRQQELNLESTIH